jgi:hypothetical protein
VSSLHNDYDHGGGGGGGGGEDEHGGDSPRSLSPRAGRGATSLGKRKGNSSSSGL